MGKLNIQTFPLKHLSVCKCGYGTLDDSIPLGTLYKLNLKSVVLAEYSCGGCHTVQTIQCILASQYLHPERTMALLPVGLFDLGRS